ncbi:NAD-dependent epimerase/dehydratase family protein [Clostridium merdae]|uniref:NAD-dependent epimerase/dehydratase family protein n=1 Tax=Clostridium merdae TaxID=1958780 RepID=UPI000A26C20B|nr:NAD-dependent epimerase/dehydratase family protein [Clostridium merdae]
MKKTTYIVTGAAGHLGSYVVKLLLERGMEVRALLLPNESIPSFIEENRSLLQEYTGNVCNFASLPPLFEGNGMNEFIVIHCAGIVSITQKEDRRVYDVNVSGTKNIIDACRQYAVKRLVYISSVHAIPSLPHGKIMREIPSFSPDAVPGYYDKTKAIATQMVLDAAIKGLDAVVIHPSGIIGPYGLPTGNMAQMFMLYMRGKLPAAVQGGFDFVDVRDVANGVISAATNGESGECYILSNRFIHLREMFDTLAKVSGRSRLKMNLPICLAKATAPFMELYYRLAGKTPLFTRYSLRTLSENAMYSHEKASNKLGYQTRPIIETITDTVTWIKEME